MRDVTPGALMLRFDFSSLLMLYTKATHAYPHTARAHIAQGCAILPGCQGRLADLSVKPWPWWDDSNIYVVSNCTHCQ